MDKERIDSRLWSADDNLSEALADIRGDDPCYYNILERVEEAMYELGMAKELLEKGVEDVNQ